MGGPPTLSYWSDYIFPVWLIWAKLLSKFIFLCDDLFDLFKVISPKSRIQFTLCLFFFVHSHILLIFESRHDTLDKISTTVLRLIIITWSHRDSLKLTLAPCPSRVYIFIGLAILISLSTERLLHSVAHVHRLASIVWVISTLLT